MQLSWCLTNIIQDFNEEKDIITSKPGQAVVETDPQDFEELLNTLRNTNGNI